MRAVQINAYGGPEVLQLSEAPMPAFSANEARIRTAAIGVNPADWKWRAGWFTSVTELSFPHILGYDLAGVVEAIGSDVTDLAVGDRVTGMTRTRKQGAYAEFVTVSADFTARIPESLDFATAAALPTPGLTGVQLVEEMLQPRAGDLVLVTGAVGGVGRFSVHAAKRLGARVVAAVRAGQVDAARAIGADHVIVLGEQDWTGPAFDSIADTVGGPAVASLCHRIGPDGKIGTVSTTPIEKGGLSVEPLFFAYHADKRRLRELAQAVADGAVSLPIAKRFPLEEAGEAHRLMETGGQGGKIVLEV